MRKLTNCIVTDNGITTIIEGRPYQVGKDHQNYSKILQTLKSKDADTFLKLYSPVATTIKPSKDFKVHSGLVVGYNSVTWQGQPLHNVVTQRLIALQAEGHDTAPLSNFLVKLMKNPSSWCVESLYKFLEAKGLPITEDGDVLAYKVVTNDWKDKYSNKVLNTIGSKHEIPRNTVDDNRTRECSYGFHVGDLSYSGPNGSYYNQGDRNLIVKFSPEDVVAVPEEASASKIRVCKYEVVSEYEKLPDTFVNVGLKNLKHGDIITFDIPRGPSGIKLKYEGISSRTGNKNFFGRLVKGTHYGEAGRSASFLISDASDIKVIK